VERIAHAFGSTFAILPKAQSPTKNAKEPPSQNTTDKERMKEQRGITWVWCNAGRSASYETFVVKQTFVLRINSSAKNPPHRQAVNRYRQG